MTDHPTAPEEPPAAMPGTGAETADAPPEPGGERVDAPPEPGGERVDPPPETGDPRVDEALVRLAGIAGQPPAEHVAVYEEVHRRLQDTLADLDDDR